MWKLLNLMMWQIYRPFCICKLENIDLKNVSAHSHIYTLCKMQEKAVLVSTGLKPRMPCRNDTRDRCESLCYFGGKNLTSKRCIAIWVTIPWADKQATNALKHYPYNIRTRLHICVHKRFLHTYQLAEQNKKVREHTWTCIWCRL